VTFDSGARVVLEGAAALEVNSAWEVTLRRGTLKANVPPEAVGFSVANRAVRVVDLGTEFTMVADANGAEVFVLKGEVEAAPRATRELETILLREKEPRRFAATGVSVATGPLNLARSGAAVLPKADGDAVVGGGITPTGSALKATPELYSVANNTFTKLGDELWADDPGWTVGPSFSSVVAIEDLRLPDGHRFLLPMTRPLEGKTEQGFVLFNADTGAFTRLITTPALPDAQAEVFLYNPMIDRPNGVAYVFAYLPGFTPTRAQIRTIHLTTGATAALSGVVEFPADYEISGASLSLLPDGRILVAGGATPGNGNFGARANTFLITPGTPANPGPTVTLDTYAGVTVAGNVGTSYLVEYATALAPEVWLPLSSVTLTNTTQLVIDPSPLSGQAKRFYRAKRAN
jgi:hypothetical protein